MPIDRGRPVRELQLSGLDALSAITALRQRIRIADPGAGVFEAADHQWWWREARPTDLVPQLFWVDDQQEPVAAAYLTAWKEDVSLDLVAMPDRAAEMVEEVTERGIAHADAAALGEVVVPVVAADTVLVDALTARGFTMVAEEDVDGWLDAASRPARSPLPDGYVSTTRDQRLSEPHHFETRAGADVADRLRQTSLYRDDLDVMVLDAAGSVVAYGLGWYDPVTRTGIVEPMRTEEGHQGRGLARHVLTAVVDLVAAAGADRIKIAWDPANTPADRLYRSVGFGPPRSCLVLGRPGPGGSATSSSAATTREQEPS